MSDYVLTASSTADLSKEDFEELNIPYNIFHYSIDNEVFPDDLYQSTTPEKFYTNIKKGIQPVTSQPNFEEYKEFFRPFLEEGKDIIHVTLSSGISGSINSAQTAANELLKEFPDRKIEVIDSLGASSGYGLLMAEAAKKRDEGLSIEKLAQWIEDNKLNMHHWFFSTDLSSYKRGGRISTASYAIGSMLNIVPLLNMDNFGKLIPRKKYRGKNKTIQKMVEQMKDHAKGGKNYSGKVFISHSDSLEDAQTVAKMIEEEFPNLDGPVKINNIGTVIGSHTGPGTVATFFWGDERID